MAREGPVSMKGLSPIAMAEPAVPEMVAFSRGLVEVVPVRHGVEDAAALKGANPLAAYSLGDPVRQLDPECVAAPVPAVDDDHAFAILVAGAEVLGKFSVPEGHNPLRWGTAPVVKLGPPAHPSHRVP